MNALWPLIKKRVLKTCTKASMSNLSMLVTAVAIRQSTSPYMPSLLSDVGTSMCRVTVMEKRKRHKRKRALMMMMRWHVWKLDTRAFAITRSKGMLRSFEIFVWSLCQNRYCCYWYKAFFFVKRTCILSSWPLKNHCFRPRYLFFNMYLKLAWYYFKTPQTCSGTNHLRARYQ